MELKRGKSKALPLVATIIAALMVVLLACTTAWAKTPSGGGSGADSDSVSSSFVSMGTSDHIDIGIKATAKLTVPDSDEPLTKEVTLVKSDFTTATATITATWKGEEFAEFDYEKFTKLSTSSGTSGIEQIRIGGKFPVGTKAEPVIYTVTVKKKVTFNDGYKDIPVTLSATFDYWDAGNDCPGLKGSKKSWENGNFVSNSGLDFTLGAENSGMGLLSIQKNVVDENGKAIEVKGSYSFDVYAYDSVTKQETKKATLTVSVDKGVGTATTYLPYGQYYIVEEGSSASSVDGYVFDKVQINDKGAEGGKSEVFTLGSTATSVSFNVKNVYKSNTTSVSVEKAWSDNNNQDGKRPESVTVHLYADGEDTAKTLTLNAANSWKGSFENLSKSNSDGTTIVYTVSEDAVEGYTATITGTAANGFTVTNAHTPETTSVSGTKTWDDANNQDGLRPDSITVNLLADGEKVESKTVTASDGWAYNFSNLAKYKSGKEITYTVSEDAVEGYEAAYPFGSYNITNKHVPETTEVTIKKVWDDVDNQDGIRSESITVELMADGLPIGSGLTAELSEENEWTCTFSGLPVRKSGEKIKYTVAEVEVPEGYESSVDGYVVTNKHTPEKTSVCGTKIWNDGADQDGLRPDSVTVRLLADGKEIDSKTVTASGGWHYSFTDLDKRKAGEEIVYTVIEDAVEGYEAACSDSGYDITNTHTPETVIVSGTKTWIGDDGKTDKRPESITVNLFANGDKLASQEVTAADGWKYSFDNLPKYDDGDEIVYTITEDDVEGYTSEVNGYNITNTLVPEDPEPQPGTDPEPDPDPEGGDPDDGTGDGSDEPKPLPKADSTPKTGDSAPVVTLALVACAAVALAAGALPAARRRK